MSRSGEVADALLGITDTRAQRAKNATLKKAYEKQLAIETAPSGQ